MSATIAAPLEVRGLTKHFPAGNGLIRRGRVHAVDDVTFALRPGTITALVGESGSGKSTVARLLARLLRADRRTRALRGRGRRRTTRAGATCCATARRCR